MTSSEFQYYLSEEFKRNLRDFSKRFPNKKQSEAFKAVVLEAIEEIMANPLAVIASGSSGVIEWRGPEPAPGFFDTQVGSRFFKAYFKIPNLKGAAGQGRIMYMVQPEIQIVDFLMFYNHAEFQGRPPDKYLKDVFREAKVPRDSEQE